MSAFVVNVVWVIAQAGKSFAFVEHHKGHIPNMVGCRFLLMEVGHSRSESAHSTLVVVYMPADRH